MKKKNNPHVYRDWKEPSDYDDLNDLSLDQWAWEFLRRNPVYIKEWKRLTQGWTDEEKEWRRSFLTAHEWGLPCYLNPELKFIYHNIQFIPFGGVERHTFFTGKTDISNPLKGKEEVLFIFNIQQPLIPQIELAKEELLKLQNNSKQKDNKIRKAFKPRRDEWILLIRILDAGAMGAPDREIARVLFPNEKSLDESAGLKKVYDKRKQALRYVNQDYRFIPFSEK